MVTLIFPDAEMVMTEVAVPLFVKPLAAAMAFTVVVDATGIAAAYTVEFVEGVVPSSV
jgi:hypothetical protein